MPQVPSVAALVGTRSTATYFPATGIVSQRNITNAGHDMFCEGLSIDSTGRFVATGGNSNYKTSIYSPANDAWTAAAQMHVPRGYASQATLSNGNIFMIGGSWAGGLGGKNGELFSPYCKHLDCPQRRPSYPYAYQRCSRCLPR